METPANDPPPANGIQTLMHLKAISAINIRPSNTRTKSAQIFLKKMTTMQAKIGAQSSLIADGDCFDIWHDYMNLGRVLQRLHDRREGDHGDPEGPKRATPGPWSHIQTSRQEDCKISPETSSVSSSASDTSSSGTFSDICRFCKQNGESSRVYQSHKLKSDDGRVICPILWNYRCPICEATGDHAHTRRYCPQLQRQETARKLFR